jgi:hypothetical protein
MSIGTESSPQKTFAFAALLAAVQMPGGVIVLAGIWLARRGT